MEKDTTLESLIGRKILLDLIVGSRNYNLSDESSDWDHKVFVMPTLKDLYRGESTSKTLNINGNDYDIKDIRELPKLLAKENIAYLETLVSDIYYCDPKFAEIWNSIKSWKDDIIINDIERLWRSSIGMMYEKKKAIEKDYPTSTENESWKRKQKYGYDTKQLMHIRRLQLMISISVLTSKNILEFIKVGNDIRKELLDIKYCKNGFSKEKALEIAEKYINETKEVVEKNKEWPFKWNVKNREPIKNIFEVINNKLEKYILENAFKPTKIDNACQLYGKVETLPCKPLKDLARATKEYISDNETWVSISCFVENIWN